MYGEIARSRADINCSGKKERDAASDFARHWIQSQPTWMNAENRPSLMEEHKSKIFFHLQFDIEHGCGSMSWYWSHLKEYKRCQDGWMHVDQQQICQAKCKNNILANLSLSSLFIQIRPRWTSSKYAKLAQEQHSQTFGIICNLTLRMAGSMADINGREEKKRDFVLTWIQIQLRRMNARGAAANMPKRQEVKVFFYFSWKLVHIMSCQQKCRWTSKKYTLQCWSHNKKLKHQTSYILVNIRLVKT